MESEVEQCSVDRKCFEIQKKELFLKNDQLLELIISQDIVHTAVNSYAAIDAPEFCKFFEINELKAQLQAKNTTISNLKNHIKELKGKSVADCTESVTKSNVIALGMLKIDLQPLSPNLRNNREAHVDYIKVTTEHADILQGIVEQARALNHLDNALDFSCQYTK
ncbi:hypothetical protein Tco_1268920 [Tanacetum coccineum]